MTPSTPSGYPRGYVSKGLPLCGTVRAYSRRGKTYTEALHRPPVQPCPGMRPPGPACGPPMRPGSVPHVPDWPPNPAPLDPPTARANGPHAGRLTGPN